MAKLKRERKASELTTNVRIDRDTVHRWLRFLSGVNKQTASDVLKELILDKYPGIEKDTSKWEADQEKLQKQYGGKKNGNGGK
jgi:hypothetical protein